MTRNHRRRAPKAATTKGAPIAVKNAVASSSQPLLDPAPAPIVAWEDIPIPESGGWADSQDLDNTWEWEAAGDDSILSGDPRREDKIRWRIEHDHIHSPQYRVRKWQEKTMGLYCTEKEVEGALVRPDDVYDGGPQRERSRSRSRSRSRGRQGREYRHQAVVAWMDREKSVKVFAPSVASDATAHDDLGSSSRTRGATDQLQAWIDALPQKGRGRGHRHALKAKALEFFELSMQDKVQKVESISRELSAICV